MKKTYLLLLAILPLFSSCNKNGGFPNPFPNDTYNKIGFTFTNDEQIVRQLTTNETELVKSFVADAANIDKKIFYKESEIHTRDYTRAFAGEFKQGYNVSNTMKDEKIVVKRQDQTSGSSYTNRARTLTNTTSTQISNYTYGNIQEDLSVNEYAYFYDENKPTSNYESDTKEESNTLNLRTQKIENGKYETTSDEKKVDKKSGSYVDSEINEFLHIHQSKYISEPDSKSGADANNNIILVKTSQTGHVDKDTGEKGVFTLKDGRSYQAMDNSLSVTKLEIKGSTDKYCVAKYVRIYTETVITSEVIQPNVPVSKLKNPITISYTEEKNYHGEKDKETGALPVIDNILPEETTK